MMSLGSSTPGLHPDQRKRYAARSQSSRVRRLRQLRQLTPTSLVVASVGLVLADWGDRLSGGASFFPSGPLDEVAHALTTVLVLWALGPRVCRRFLVPAIIASVAIDLDHVPGQLGSDWLTAGTPRPYTHSLLTNAIVLAAALVVRRRRDVLLGIALGLVSHFFRDLSEPGSGVALLWPWTNHSFSLSHTSYVVTMTIVVLIDALRLFATRRSRSRSGR